MSHDPTDLRGQQQRAEREAARLRVLKENEADDYRWLMSSDRGRRLMWNWLGTFGLFRTPFNSSGSVQSFNCGMHNAALTLNAAVMEHCPEHAITMQQEAKVRLKGADN